MKTRKEYLDGTCTHDEYYGQFVDERVKKIVLSRFSKDELKRAYDTNPHLNSIDLSTWDGLAQSINYIPF